MPTAPRVQRVESNEVATPHHVCPHCGQRMLMRHGVRSPPLLADLFDMIERSATRGVLCEALAWRLSWQGVPRCAALRRRQCPPPQQLPRADRRPRRRRQGRADRQAVPGGATKKLEQKDMTKQEVFDGLVQRLLASGEINHRRRARTDDDRQLVLFLSELGRRSRPSDLPRIGWTRRSFGCSMKR